MTVFLASSHQLAEQWAPRVPDRSNRRWMDGFLLALGGDVREWRGQLGLPVTTIIVRAIRLGLMRGRV